MKVFKYNLSTSLSLFIVIFSPIITPFQNPPPNKLDNALIGPASKKNPLFVNVLKTPVTDGEWTKVGENAYIGPNGGFYIYNVRKGEIEKSGKTTQIGNTTYDHHGNILRYIIKEKDSTNNIIKYYDFSGFTYSKEGNLTGYARTDRYPEGPVFKRHIYTDFSYYNNSKTMSYIRTDFNSNEKKEYQYNFQIDTDGKYTSYKKVSFDEAGSVNAINIYTDFQYDKTGKIDSYICVDQDIYGNTIVTHEYLDRTYDSTGKLISYEWIKKDAQGHVVVKGTWSS